MLKKLDYVSKRIGFAIKPQRELNDKYIIIFTGNGLRRLFPKMIALENQTPTLEHFTTQVFIKPLQDTTMYKDGTDEPCVCKNLIKIDLYLPHYNKLKQFDDLESTIEHIVMQIIGEIAFRKHMREINLHQMPLEPKGLLSLIELPDFIGYLYKINSRKKTRMI
jgi:hypothetical protein